MIDDRAVRSLIGAPFELGARGPDRFDCYGLVLHVLRLSGNAPPDYTSPEDGVSIRNLFKTSLEVWEQVQPRPGVMMVYRLPGTWHCGIHLSGNRLLHAWQACGGVMIDELDFWRRRLVGAYVYRGE